MQIAANIALVKNMTLHGIYWGSYMMNKPAVLRGSLQELVKWLAEGKISVPVSHKCGHPNYGITARLEQKNLVFNSKQLKSLSTVANILGHRRKGKGIST